MQSAFFHTLFAHLHALHMECDFIPAHIVDSAEDARAGSQPFMHASEIMPGLYIGPYKMRDDVERLKIHWVLSFMTADERTQLFDYRAELPDGVHEAKYTLADTSDTQLQLPVLIAWASLIGSARAAGLRVLIHCQAGVSRSVCVVIAYMLLYKMAPTARDALRLIRRQRACAAPNRGFMRQLTALEASIRAAAIAD